MKYGVMSFQWMHVICCWGDHDNMTEKSYMMEGRILTPSRRMDLRSYYFPLRMKGRLRICCHKRACYGNEGNKILLCINGANKRRGRHNNTY